MAAINFPNSPVIGQEHIVGTIKYKWTGIYWQSVTSLALANISDWPTAVSATEVGYLDGVTSAIQTQINSKAALTGSTTQAFACSNLAFPATQVSSADANTLDDYEEGTFSPTISGTTTAGTGTYTTQVGRYTKIGRIVYFTIKLGWSAHTGTGNMIVSGLPFTSNSTAGVNWICSAFSELLTWASGSVLKSVVLNNSTSISLYLIATSTGGVSILPMDTSVTSLIITGFYEV